MDTKTSLPVVVGYINFPALSRNAVVGILSAIITHLPPMEIVRYFPDFINLGMTPRQIFKATVPKQYTEEVIGIFVRNNIGIEEIMERMPRIEILMNIDFLNAKGAKLSFKTEAEKLSISEADYYHPILAHNGYDFKPRLFHSRYKPNGIKCFKLKRLH